MTRKNNPFLESMPPPPTMASNKERELYALAAIANGIVLHQLKPEDKNEKNDRYDMSLGCIEELKEWAENKGPKPKNVLVFLDENLYLGCDALGIKFEIGEAWENRNAIKNDLDWELKNLGNY